MKGALCLVLALAAGPASAAGSAATPIQKVLDLLANMMNKGKSEKHAEQVQYAAYKQFCDDTTMEKEAAIEEAEKRIKLLLGEIEKYAADIAKLDKEIAGHEEDISVWKGDEAAASKVRAIEKKDYDATHQDYTESIEAIEMALAVLKKQAYENPASFVQISDRLKSLSLIPTDAKRAIDAFIAQGDADYDVMPAAVGDVNSPEAAAYENQSGGVIGMLEKLLTKFQGERTTLEKEETDAVFNFDMIMQDLKAQIEAAEDDVSDGNIARAKAKEAKATAEADLADTKASLEADQQYLADLTATCTKKGDDFAARQQLRGEELEAIAKAMEIISGGAVAGSAEKHGLHSALLEAGDAASLAQLRADARSPSQERAAQYLTDQAGRIGSRVLSAIALRAAGDPFKKVKKMIQDMIYRLQEEATAEASQKGWCDTELSTNEHTRKEKSEEVEGLKAEIDSLTASIALLKEEIGELTKAIEELDAAMSKATHLRIEEKAKNIETIADAQAAQTAVAQALTVLQEFYAKAAEATAFVQQGQEPPPIFEDSFNGQQGANTGVVGMLEVIESDFARLEAETKAAEAAAQAEYDKFMHDSEMDKTAKSKDVEHKTIKLQDEEQALVSKEEDLEGAEKELHAALEYFDKLKPSCVDSGVSYDNRVAQRKAELESLEEALRILNGESMP